MTPSPAIPPAQQAIRDRCVHAAGTWREFPAPEAAGSIDDFFALGGTSLQAMALVGRLQPVFGDAVTVTMLFEAPTVADLAARLDSSLSPRA